MTTCPLASSVSFTTTGNSATSVAPSVQNQLMPRIGCQIASSTTRLANQRGGGAQDAPIHLRLATARRCRRYQAGGQQTNAPTR